MRSADVRYINSRPMLTNECYVTDSGPTEPYPNGIGAGRKIQIVLICPNIVSGWLDTIRLLIEMARSMLRLLFIHDINSVRSILAFGPSNMKPTVQGDRAS